MKKTSLLTAGGTLALALCLGANLASAAPWKFGVISDTQWTKTDDGYNPNTCAANIIKQLDNQFIAAHVKLVVHVGDMVDSGSQVNDYTRALYAQDLYNAGIGFYPLRGNHEAANGTYTNSAADFRHAYPQILPGGTAGWNNATPGDITTALIPSGDLLNNPPAAMTGSPFQAGFNFTAPTAANTANDAVSYAFDYNNATFMLLDQFQSPDYYTSHIPEQMDWIDSTLASRPAHTHAFAFTHKNILGGNHKDNMFGGQVTGADPGDCAGLNFGSLTADQQAAMLAKTELENAFIGSMQSNDVKFVISGHDHHHYNSIVTSPDQQSKVHQLIMASDSSKFYTPGTPASTNDVAVEQELSRIGYYLFTVDGPRVTVDYYADPTADKYSGTFNFVKRSTTGYSLNGQEFVVAEGGSYATVADTTAKAVANGETGYIGTAMQILAGSNGSATTNNYGKAQSKAVNTGWSTNATGSASDVLSLWGLQQIGAASADIYVLSLSYNPAAVANPTSGAFALAGKDSFGHWVNAVDLNTGGVRQFVSGAYSSSYPLGTYGVDTASHTVWAVVNHQGDFAAKTVSEVVNFIYTSDNHYGIVRPIFRGGFNVSGQTVNEAMIARMNTLPAQSFPNDGGVAAGQAVGNVDFLMDTGDIANRSETNSAITANPALPYLGGTVNYPGNTAYVAPVSSVTWAQWQQDFLGNASTGNNAGGLLTLTNNAGQGIPVFLSPGNHDISDSIGMNGKIAAENVDATSYVQIYNRMTPYSGKSPIATNVFANPGNFTNVNLQVNYSFNVGGVHVVCVNMFPDKNILNWMTADLANVAASTPVFLFCHAPVNLADGEYKVFGNPTNTSSSAGADIPFALNGTDSATSYVDMNAAKQYVADWLIVHPNVRALFSGHDNFNGATNWNGQDASGNLIASRDAAWPGVTLFRVDSPMKGDVSGVSASDKVGVETNLSFQVYSYDIATRRLTEREYLWNPTVDGSGDGVWSGQSVTIDLNFPASAPALAGPANGTVVTNGFPTLTWSSVTGATGYTVALTSPSGTAYYSVAGTSLPLSFPLTNGVYSWTVTAKNSTGSGPVSDLASFTLNRSVSTAKWSFGVMSDTQWTGVGADPVGNPNNVAVSIINQLNPQFINAGVDFVVQVGDLTQDGNVADVDVTAAARQALYDAGIGFFPLRGNHESSQAAALRVTNDFPQTQGLGTNVGNAINFISASNSLKGLSYAFDYNNARFVLLDQFTRLDGTGSDNNNAMVDQVPWIGTAVSNRPAGTHAFVFTHKNLIGENHMDMMFGASPASNPATQNQFFAALQGAGVRYVMSGHDHVHQRSLIASPDGLSALEELICASDSSKFYTPQATNASGWAGQKYRETPLAQELYSVGYYIFTVTGQQVTVDYYSSDERFPSGNSPNPTPTLHFHKRETFGYSLNGQSFLVPQGQSYTSVQSAIVAGSGFIGTTAVILGGTNASTTIEGASSLRPITKEITTGWTPATGDLVSDVFSLLGMTEIGSNQTDVVAISLNYNPAGVSDDQIASSLFCLVSRDANGNWVKAVNANTGGTKTFVNGPWNASYALGTYGVDKTTHTAWAIVNHASDFAVAQLPPQLQITGPDAQGSMNVTWPTTLLPGYVLEFNADLGTTNWVRVNGNGFFRLVK